jgi:DNA-binding SARP family transcriptional activator
VIWRLVQTLAGADRDRGWGESVRIQLLGPMSMEIAGNRITLGAPKHRALLATLALQRCDVVSIDALAEAIWEGNPPGSWRTTLRNYVKRIRASLACEAPLLHTHHPGYSLEISRLDLDVFVFEDRATEGRSAAWSRDWDNASRILSEALALWQGTPLADVDSPHLQQRYVTYLEDLRLSAIAKRIEADLRISGDRAPDLMPELRRLSNDHPADERFRGQFMIALCMSGRTAEALAAYQDAWRYAKEEFGTEPGASLQQLHRRILAAETDLWD